MSYRIWNTTKKDKPRNAKERVGHMLHINDQLIAPGRSVMLTDDQFAAKSTYLASLQAENFARIEPLSSVSKEQKQELEQQVAFERKVAEERAREKSLGNNSSNASMTGFESKPRSSEQPGYDPNNDSDDMPFANTVDESANSHDNFTVRAQQKKSRKAAQQPPMDPVM